MNAPFYLAPGSTITGETTEDAGSYTIVNSFNFGDVGSESGGGDFHGIGSIATVFATRPAGYPPSLGALTADITNDATGPGDTDNGTVQWSYSVDNAAIQFLAAGETYVQEFDVTIGDGDGNSFVQRIKITINGTNDGPVFSSSNADPAAFSEDGPLAASGSFAFTDVDVRDVHTTDVSVVASGTTTGMSLDNAALEALLTATPSSSTTQADGSVAWSFAGTAADFQYLAANETLTLTYTVTVKDDAGVTASRTVTVNIEGSNDTPVINATSPAADAEADSSSVVNGSVAAAVSIVDPDVSDVRVPYVANTGELTSNGPTPPDGDLGDLFDFDRATGTYNYDRADFNWLDGDQAVTYTITFDAGSGADIVGKSITITINGQNDDAEITVGAVPDQTESNTSETVAFSVAGYVTITDADSQDAAAPVDYVAGSGTLATTSTLQPPSGTLTGLIDFIAVDGTVSYDRADFNWLDAGQSITYTIEFQAKSGDDTSQTKTLTFIINGENDAAVVTVTNRADVSEDATDGPVRFTIADQVSITDVDSQDAVAIDYVAGTGTITGNGAAPPAGITFANLVGFVPETGEISYDPASFGWLAAGESVTYTANFQSRSGNDDPTNQSFTFTITGANDGPVLVSNSNPTPAAIADPVGTGSTTLSATAGNSRSGTIVFDDVDERDTLTLGTDATFDAQTDIGAIRSNATFAFSNLDAAAGLTAGDITDIRNAFDITSASFNAATNELSVNWTFDNVVSGTDAVAGLARGPVGTINLNFLAAGETLTVTFPVTVFDGTTTHIVNVPILFTGTNDAPTGTQTRSVFITEGGAANPAVSGSPGSARFVDPTTGTQVDNVSGSGYNNGFASGTHTVIVNGSVNTLQRIAFSDTDRTDLSHTVAVSSVTIAGTGADAGEPVTAAALGWLTTSLTQRTSASGSGQIQWTFQAPDSAFDYLSVGDTLVLTYQLDVTDTGNLTSSGPGRTVTVTITGTNDAPVISVGTGDSASAAATETNAGITLSNTLTVTDLDLNDSDLASVAFTSATGPANGIDFSELVTVTGTDITDATTGTGKLTWVFNSGSQTFDYLAQGEELVLTYTITVNDGHGSTVTRPVTVTITGSNDGPVLAVGGDSSETIAETDGVQAVSTTGSFDVSDADLTDVLSITEGTTSVVWSGGDTVPADVLAALTAPGALTVSDTNGAINLATVAWSFGANANFDFLDQGETLTITVPLTISDDATPPASVTRNVVVTITGTNDGPVAVDDTNDVAEGGSLTVAAADGVLANDTDADTNHVLSVSQVGGLAGNVADPVAGSAGGTFTIKADGSYSFAAGSDFEDLALGETRTTNIGYTVTDEHGATSTATLTVTVRGTNDNPVITPGGVITGSAADLTTTDVTTPINLNGSFAFTDDDTSDVPTIGTIGFSSDLPNPSDAQTAALNNLYDKFSATFAGGSPVNGDGTLNWTFNPLQKDLDFLRQGQTVHLTFAVPINDGHDGVATRNVTITLTGANDPIIHGPGVDDSVGDVTEPGTAGGAATDSGVIDFREPDLGANNVILITRTGGTMPEGHQTPTLTRVLGDPDANGVCTLTWTYTNSHANLDFLGAGDSVTEIYNIRIANDLSSNGFLDFPITVTVHGTNDAPVISTVSSPAPIEEAANASAQDIGAVTGTLTVTDVDTYTADILTASATGDVSIALNGIAYTLPGGAEALIDSGALTFGAPVATTGAAQTINWTYNPAAANLDFLGAGDTLTLSFAVVVKDGLTDSNTQTITITVTGTNDAPTVTADADTFAGFVGLGDTTGNNVLANDSDVDDSQGDLTITAIQSEEGGSVTVTAGDAGATIVGEHGTLTMHADGSYSYVASNPKNSFGTDTFTYTVSDGHAGGTSATTLTIEVTEQALRTLDASSLDENGFIFAGTTIPGTNFNVSENHAAGLELGLKVSYRQGVDITPASQSGDGTATFLAPSGSQVVDPTHGVLTDNAGRAAWSLAYSINTQSDDGSTKSLSDYAVTFTISDGECLSGDILNASSDL